MKPTITLCACLLALTSRAQDCNINFIDQVFGWTVENDVVYGTVNTYSGSLVDLSMNIYKPVGDGQMERPILLFVHGGGFIGGTKEDMDSLCANYAARGYVCATPSYRLGFYAPNLSFNPFAYDEDEVVRAAYRAMQDVRGAVRFLKGRSAQDSSSVDQFYIGGFSAGAIAALHVTYVTDPAEKPAAAGAIADVAHTFNTYPRPDLGDIEGDVALNGQNSTVKACVSFFGGLLDTALIDGPNDPPLFLYHQTGDPTVGCDHQRGLWNMPFNVGQNYPYLYGSCVIDDRLMNLGFAPEDMFVHIFNGNQHDVHDPVLLDQQTASFLAAQVCPQNVGIPELERQAQVVVRPNPSNGPITIELLEASTIDRLNIHDLSGRKLMAMDLADPTGLARLDLGHLPDGQYFLYGMTSNGTAFNERIILLR